MSLEDDIARIARLRGMGAQDVAAMHARQKQRESQEIAAQTKRVTMNQNIALSAIFKSMEGSVREQMAAYNDLPKRSRDFLKRSPYDISARRWAIALEAFGCDEESLIAAVEKLTPPR